MGTKFSSIAISGYNSSPPSDDGATNADNQLQWAKHLSKIGNPIKTAVESINTALVTALDQSARSTSSTTTAVSTDHNRVIEIAAAVSTGITISLSDAATMADGYIVNVHNLSSVQHTLARVTAGDFINGVASNVPIAPFSMIKAWVNAAENGYLVSASPILNSRATFLTNSLSGDVSLSNTGLYFDGPVVAQGTSGTWFVSGTITVIDSTVGGVFFAKLWDGTTVIASAIETELSASIQHPISLSGFIASPVGNIRISVKNSSSVNGLIVANLSGNSKDSTITAIRIG